MTHIYIYIYAYLYIGGALRLPKTRVSKGTGPYHPLTSNFSLPCPELEGISKSGLRSLISPLPQKTSLLARSWVSAAAPQPWHSQAPLTPTQDLGTNFFQQTMWQPIYEWAGFGKRPNLEHWGFDVIL